jgi:uncharacterized membrane protein
MNDFLYKYYIEPIWARTGYNMINTATYAIIALFMLYLLWVAFKKYNVIVDRNFLYNVLPFVLLGSTVRVVTDAIDSGVFTPVTPIHALVLSSHIYDYGYFTVSPGIYIVIAALLLLCIVVLRIIKKQELLGKVALALWLPHFLLLLPFMNFVVYTLPVLLLVVIPTYVAWRYFKDSIYALIVAGHALDGAATFFIIDIFSKITGNVYFEQHVVGGFIGKLFGTFFAFYIVKILLAFGIAYLISKENEMSEEERNYIALAIMIMGFAPGIRSLIRMTIGA